MLIKANFVKCKNIVTNGKTLYLCTCISQDLGNFNFFSTVPLNFDYLKMVSLEFEVSSFNGRLGLKFLSVK